MNLVLLIIITFSVKNRLVKLVYYSVSKGLQRPRIWYVIFLCNNNPEQDNIWWGGGARGRNGGICAPYFHLPDEQNWFSLLDPNVKHRIAELSNKNSSSLRWRRLPQYFNSVVPLSNYRHSRYLDSSRV